MLNSIALTALSNCNLDDFTSKAGRLGLFRCGSRRRDNQDGVFGRKNSADNPKTSTVWGLDRNTAFLQAYSSRALKSWFWKFENYAGRGRNVECGKIDGGDFLNAWNYGTSDGVVGKSDGIRFVRCRCEMNNEHASNDLSEKRDGGFDRMAGHNGRMEFVRGSLERRREPKRKSERFWLENYDGCNLNSEMLGKIYTRDSLKCLAIRNSGSGESVEKDRDETDDLRLKRIETDGNFGIRENSVPLDEAGVDRQEKSFEFERYIENAEMENQTMDFKVDNLKVSGVGSTSSTFDLLELERDIENEQKVGGSAAEEDNNSVTSKSSSGKSVEPGEVGRQLRSQRQVMRRSNILAKQVISMQSALRLGFVSQLWVDTKSWVVLLVEVRPSMLSGDMERFLLDDVCQVGDVVLVHDESVTENDLKMIGLDTLVGYNVVTPGRRNVGKVRGYTFNINSGAVELLELDSFGISIIPSSLVSTYGLFVDDVLEVSSDTVVVHEDAVSHLQRLTKGFWNSKNLEFARDERDEYPDLERWSDRSSHHPNKPKNFRGQRFTRGRAGVDDWELPMDY